MHIIRQAASRREVDVGTCRESADPMGRAAVGIGPFWDCFGGWSSGRTRGPTLRLLSPSSFPSFLALHPTWVAGSSLDAVAMPWPALIDPRSAVLQHTEARYGELW